MTVLPASPPRRLLLVSSPRTASNLLLKIINLKDQSDVISSESGGYFFFQAFTTAATDGRLSKALSEWSDEVRTEVQSAFQKCVDELEEYTERAAKEGKMLFAKEHAFWFWNPASINKIASGNAANGTANGSKDKNTLFRLQFPDSYGACDTFTSSNETILPDDYLRTWRLTFIIRHPALMCPSLYRAMQKMIRLGVLKEHELGGVLVTNSSLQWPRMLYDWATEQKIPGAEPLILDAHDVIHNPQTVVKFAEQAGLDVSKLVFEWESKAVPQEAQQVPQNISGLDHKVLQENPAVLQVMMGSINGSSGVLKEKAPETVDIPAEVAKWKEEFGEEGAAFLEKVVLAAMPDYEYLKERRVRVGEC